MSKEFDALYAKAGRQSIAPERLLRALLLQLFYSIRSERMLIEQLNYRWLFRWFVGGSRLFLRDQSLLAAVAPSASSRVGPFPTPQRANVNRTFLFGTIRTLSLCADKNGVSS